MFPVLHVLTFVVVRRADLHPPNPPIFLHTPTQPIACPLAARRAIHQSKVADEEDDEGDEEGEGLDDDAAVALDDAQVVLHLRVALPHVLQRHLHVVVDADHQL